MESLTRPPRKTVEDLLALGPEVRAELIGGEIFVTPAPEFRHQHAVTVLAARLFGWSESRETGHVVVSPMDVYLPSGDVVEPDVLFFGAAKRGLIQRWVRGVPDLLVEVLSPSSARHDRVVKRRLYEANGVPEYWIVDLEERVVEVLRLGGGALRVAERLGPGAALASPLLPGFGLPVADLFFE